MTQLDKKAIRQRTLELLCEKFPNAFFPLNKPPKPLDLKIFNAILDKLKTKNEKFKVELKIFMAWYTTRKQYLHEVIAIDSKRVNLAGEEVENISDFYRSQAKTKLEEELKREADIKTHKERQEQKAREQLNQELKQAFDRANAKRKAIMNSIVLNIDKPKLTLR